MAGSTLDYSSYGGTLSFGNQMSAFFGGALRARRHWRWTTATAAVALTVGNNNQNTTDSGASAEPAAWPRSCGRTLTLSGPNSYSGGTTLAGGELSISAGNNLAPPAARSSSAAGSCRSRGTAVSGMGSYAVNWSTFNGGFDVANAANVFAVSNAISGTGGLTKLGTGILTSRVNTYSGSTTLTAGELSISASNNLSAGSPGRFQRRDPADHRNGRQRHGELLGQLVGVQRRLRHRQCGQRVYRGQCHQRHGQPEQAGPRHAALDRFELATAAAPRSRRAGCCWTFPSRAPAGNILSNSGGLTLGGGTLDIKGNPGGTSAQTVGALTINGGTGGIALSANGASSWSLTTGPLTINGAATLDVVSGAKTTLTIGNTWSQGSGASLLIDLTGGSLTSSPATTNGLIWLAGSR